MNESNTEKEVKESMGVIATLIPYYEFVAKAFAQWSAEFSALLGIVFTLLSMDLLPKPFVVVLLMFFVCLFSFGIAYKFGFAIYKDYKLQMIEIKKKEREAENG